MSLKHWVEIHGTGRRSERHAIGAGLRLEWLDSRLRPAPLAVAPKGTAGLELVVANEGVSVRLMQGTPNPLIVAGRAASEATVAFGDELYWGELRLSFLAEAARPTLLLAGLAAAALVIVGVFALRESVDERSRVGFDAPDLTLPAASCDRQGPADMKPRAQQLMRAATAKEQSYPFVTGDGLIAAGYLAQAVACAEGAGDTVAVAALQQEQARWTQKLRGDYRALQLQLKLALEQKRDGEALKSTRLLLELLEKQPPGKYITWLTDLSRRLENSKAS